MRRLQMEASLVVLWLLASGGFGYASGPPKKPSRSMPQLFQVAKPLPRSNEKLFAQEVSGWGESVEDAESDALKRARAEIRKYFAEQGVVLSWTLPTDYIARHLVKATSPQEAKEMPGLGQVREMRLRIELGTWDYDDIMRQDHQIVSQNRMFILAKVLAGMVVFLAAVAGYFRLEDATKGYYTTWLRVGALGLVVAVMVALLSIG